MDRSETRTETARRHDDGDLVDRAEKAPEEQGRAGGNLATKVSTRDAKKRVKDADAHTRPMKSEEKGLKEFDTNETPDDSV